MSLSWLREKARFMGLEDRTMLLYVSLQYIALFEFLHNNLDDKKVVNWWNDTCCLLQGLM